LPLHHGRIQTSAGASRCCVKNSSSGLVAIALCVGALTLPARSQPPILRYADRLIAYTQGPGAQPGYTTPSAALGPPAADHTPTAPVNDDPQSGAPLVVSLGQGGSI